MKPCANHADGRGNVTNRRNRKRWLLSVRSPFGGNGWSVPCYWCRRPLTAEDLEVDRWPLCGHAGGSYRRDNIVPACSDCNRTRCSRKGAVCRSGGQQVLAMLAGQEVAHAG